MDELGRAWKQTPPLPAVVSGVLHGIGLLEGTQEPEQELPEELRNLTALQLLRDRQMELQAEGIAVPTALLKG